MAAWVAPAIMAGGAIGGGLLGYMSSQNASGKAEDATQYGIDFQRQMYENQRRDMAPYRRAGGAALHSLRDWWTTQTDPEGNTWRQKNLGLNAKGDSQQYLDQLKSLGEGSQFGANFQTADPTAQSRGIMQQLQDFGQNFQFNENDPVYQYKKQQADKGINQYLASRGLYNSRPGMNMLAESNQSLIAEDADKQYQRGYGALSDLYNMSTQMGGVDYQRSLDDYGRQVDDYNRGYGSLTDLFNMASQQGQVDYSKALDMIKIGQGAAASTGQAGIATGQGVASSYGDMAGNELLRGASDRDFWSGMGAMPLNFMTLQQMFGNQNQGVGQPIPLGNQNQGVGQPIPLGDPRYAPGRP